MCVCFSTKNCSLLNDCSFTGLSITLNLDIFNPLGPNPKVLTSKGYPFRPSQRVNIACARLEELFVISESLVSFLWLGRGYLVSNILKRVFFLLNFDMDRTTVNLVPLNEKNY